MNFIWKIFSDAGNGMQICPINKIAEYFYVVLIRKISYNKNLDEKMILKIIMKHLNTGMVLK